MEIKEIKLKDCKIDSEFTKVNESTYSCVSKAIIGEDAFESIIYLELSNEHYEYINSFNYKELLFNLKGVFQIRKNKKDMPFMLFKVTSIINTEERLQIIEERKERLKQRTLMENKKKNKKKPEELKMNKHNWVEYVPGVQDNLIEMKMDKVKIINKVHKRRAVVDLKKINRIVVVKEIDNTDEYELVFGYSTFIKCKILDLPANVYITDKTRNEFIKYVNDIYDSMINNGDEIE